VKFFDPVRRWGFIVPDDERQFDGSDVFLPWLTVRECGIAEVKLREGKRVRFRWRPPAAVGRRPEAIDLVLV
jgi:cold shock CspA family protein